MLHVSHPYTIPIFVLVSKMFYLMLVKVLCCVFVKEPVDRPRGLIFLVVSSAWDVLSSLSCLPCNSSIFLLFTVSKVLCCEQIFTIR